jgi:integrase
VSGRRDRVANPTEAASLIAAVADQDRALWATAFYAGLRRGELMALRWQDVDLAAGIIRVERGWDDREGLIELKSRAGRRRVPIIPELRDRLVDHRLLTGRDAGLVFGRDERTPFSRAVSDRADSAWREANLTRVTLHACRHTFASLMIAAGVNAKALSTYLGHANISVTLDLYGHLMPGAEAEAAGLLDAYLTVERERADATARAGGRGDGVPENAPTGASAGASVP